MEGLPTIVSVAHLEEDHFLQTQAVLREMIEMQNTISIGQEATLERIDETVEHVDGRFDIVDGRFDYVDGRIDDLMKLNTVIATSVNANETRKLKQDLKKCQETIGDLLRENSSLKLQKSELLREIRRLEKLNEKNLSKLSMKY